MPELLSVYAAFSDKLDATSLEAIHSAETAEERTRAICVVLSHCENELLAVLKKFEALCKSATPQELTLIENAGMFDRLAEFEQRIPIRSAEDLIQAISSCADGALSAEELERIYLGTLRGTVPYLAFAIDIENHS